MTTTYRGKRLLDLMIVALFAVPALGIGLCCAVLILWDDGRPVLFRQTRAGRDGIPFTLLKLRTMSRHTPPESEVPRADLITRTGKWMRRLSIDELPQLINVVRGEMSIVGPRPTLRDRAGRYAPSEKLRLAVLPGLTGLAQVSGRNALSWQGRTSLDITYVQQQSLGLDLAILARSVRVVVSGAGIEGHPEPDLLEEASLEGLDVELCDAVSGQVVAD